MTTGTLLFWSGIIVMVMAVILTIVTVLTAPKEKAKIQQRMKEKY